MVSKALAKLSKELGRVSIPSYIHIFLSEKGKEITNFREAYSQLIDWMPKHEPTPTLNEAILYYNMARLQEIADAQLRAIESNEKKMAELLKHPEENKSEIGWYKGNLERLERKYHDIAKDLMKYADGGVDRETPKLINVTNNIVDLASIHQTMRDIKNITPKE